MAKHKRPSRPPEQKKPPLTHFLCLPLVTSASKPQLEASLAKFSEDVTSQGLLESSPASESAGKAGLPYVHPKAIRPVGALHCTLGVMSLDADKLKAATALLGSLDIQGLLGAVPGLAGQQKVSTSTDQRDAGPKSLERPITPPKTERSNAPLVVNLKALESMHAPQSTSILYAAPADASGRMYNFCLALQKTFQDHGLLVDDNRELKLHATIVNTIYAKGRKQPQRKMPGSGGPPASADDRSLGHGPNAKALLRIDATYLLERYKDYTWAENVVLDRVTICEMGAKKILDEQGNVKAEEYTEVASLALPI